MNHNHNAQDESVSYGQRRINHNLEGDLQSQAKEKAIHNRETQGKSPLRNHQREIQSKWQSQPLQHKERPKGEAQSQDEWWNASRQSKLNEIVSRISDF